MIEIFKNIKAKIGITLSSLLSALGISGGSASVVCQTTCSTTTGVLPLIGISLSATPFAFIEQYQFYIWWVAFLFFLLLLWLFIKKELRTKTDKALLFINGGLLLIGTPYLRDRLSEVFVWVGLGLFIAGFIMLLSAVKSRLFGKKFKISVTLILFAVVIGSFAINQYLIYKMGVMNYQTTSPIKQTTGSMSNMKLTPFDVALAKEGNKPTTSVLGSQHIHADFKVYMNGQALDFAKPEYYMKSSFMHVDNNQNKEDSSGVLHMHAKNVPLWLFFRSIGMNLDKDSLLKFYLNGKKVDNLDNYVFQDLDKLLISYGPENDPNIQTQLNSVTNFAKDH